MTKAFKIVFLIGMPGVGKTFLGSYAAQKLGITFIDLDKEITENYQMSIAEIFETKGEQEFRHIEFSTLNSIIKQCSEDAIVATGGGTPCFNNAMELMNKSGITLWLDAGIEDIYFNIMQNNPDRPLFKGVKKDDLMRKLGEMKERRIKFYKQCQEKVSIHRGFSPDLFTKSLLLSTFAK